MDVGGEIFASAREFDKQFRERFGYAADYHVASGAACVLTLKSAIEKANTLDPKKSRWQITVLHPDSIEPEPICQPWA